MVLLIGIVKKNGIMLVDFAIVAERDQGLSPLEAIRRACLLRFRPILMTTMAAVLGGVPLMLGHGTGSDSVNRWDTSMVGGLIGQPGTDTFHHAGGLSLSRPRLTMAQS